MKEKILIVEDEFIVAHNLQMVLEKAGYKVIGIADSVKQAQAILELRETDLVLLDIYLKGKLTGIDLAGQLQARHIPFIYISANANEKVLEAAKSTHPYGLIVKPYRDSDVLLSIDIARYRYLHNAKLKQSGELYMQGVIDDITRNPLSRDEKLMRIVSAFQPYIPFDFVAITGLTTRRHTYNEVCISRTRFDEYRIIPFTEILQLAGISERDYHMIHRTDGSLTTEAIYSGGAFDAVRTGSLVKELFAQSFALQSNLVKPIMLENDELAIFSFYSRIKEVYSQEHLDLLAFLQRSLKASLQGVVNNADARPAAAKIPARETQAPFKADTGLPFEGIIGSSTALLKVLDQIKIVAGTDTSVLITGESGTGKEMIAANLHRLSTRHARPMVTVNCAALPAELIESILFGHEKGAFTGATEQRIGKFEEANGGTIFLDEIGEMPFELQSKLLRVLQEKEIERIGGKSPILINLRIIAATNRNLEKEVALGRFRLDLYYRLNVFPIHVPPLRERRNDIAELTDYFVQKYARKLKKNITGVAKPLTDALHRYSWPGNIRELEHLIERGVLLCQTTIIDEALLDLSEPGAEEEAHYHNTGIKTIEENERDHILSVLNKCNGKIAGEDGAAYLLGIPATTLSSKIKKLGIKR